MSYALTKITANIDMDLNDNTGYQYFLIDAGSNNVNVDLTNQIWDGLTFIYCRTDSSTSVVSLTAKTGTTINNAASINIAVGQMAEIVCYGTNWYAHVY